MGKLIDGVSQKMFDRLSEKVSRQKREVNDLRLIIKTLITDIISLKKELSKKDVYVNDVLINE